MQGFKQFLLRGNVVDMAVGIVVGAAFGTVVTSLVKDLLTPLIAAIVHTPDFSAMAFELNGSKFLIGDFINAVVSFLIIASAVYFAVVLPINALRSYAQTTSRRPNNQTMSRVHKRNTSPSEEMCFLRVNAASLNRGRVRSK